MVDLAYKIKPLTRADSILLALGKARTAPKRALRRSLSGLGYGLPLILVLCLLWEVAPRIGLLNPIFFPPLTKILRALVDILGKGSLLADVVVSLRRSIAGFSLAVMVAIPMGLLMGRYSRFEKVTDLLMQTLRNTPQYALLPVFILVMGIGEASKIAITFYASIWMLLINTVSGVKSVDPLLVKAAKSMGTSDVALFRKVVLPASIPSIVSGARLAVKASVVSVIGAEMLAAQSGVGHLIQNAQLMMRVPEMYAGILTLTVIGLVINYLLVWLEKKATGWKVSRDSWSF
jgi:NitT/TauT family transport system permease protein